MGWMQWYKIYVYMFTFATGINCNNRLGSAVQCSEEDHSHARFSQDESINKQLMGYIVNWIVPFERLPYFLSFSNPHSV